LNITVKNADVLFLEPDCKTEKIDVHISGSEIAAVGPAVNFTADRIIDGSGKLLVPGLINCHTHAYMTGFRNFADDLPFNDWLFNKIMPAEEIITSEDAYWCNLLSCLEMIRTGTTCFADMHMFKNQSVKAAAESGLRAVISRGLVGENITDPAAQTRINEAFDEMDYAARNSRITFMLAPHAIYTCGEDLLRGLPGIAANKKIGLNIHIAESKYEFDTSMQKHGCSPAAYLNSLNFFDVPVLAAHCVYSTEKDIEIYARHNVSIVTNPVSNMKLANGFAPVKKMLDAGINVCVGTDSAASNNTLNMFREMSVLSYIHKGLDEKTPGFPAGQTLQLVLLNGAKALGLQNKIGSIKPGMKADLVLIDLDKPWMQPLNNPVSSLVYSANGTETDTVIVDGKILMDRGVVKTLDQERIFYEVNRVREKIK